MEAFDGVGIHDLLRDKTRHPLRQTDLETFYFNKVSMCDFSLFTGPAKECSRKMWPPCRGWNH